MVISPLGHTVAVILVGYCCARSHKPQWTAFGVLLSAFGVFVLTLPTIIWGLTFVRDEHESSDCAGNENEHLLEFRKRPEDFQCRLSQEMGGGGSQSDDTLYSLHVVLLFDLFSRRYNTQSTNGLEEQMFCKRNSHWGAYSFLIIGQLLCGIGAAPFNTLAYIYIDENVTPRQSPLFLGLLTSMFTAS